MRTKAAHLLLVLLVSVLSFAAKVPDIPTGSKIFLENKSTSDESQMFTELFREKLGKDESTRTNSKPGFPVVDTKEDAAYVLRFIFVMRDEHARVNVWLLDSKGTTVWEHNYDCVRVIICDRCKSKMRLVNGRRGKFWGCSRYPECNFTRRYEHA